MQKLSAFSVLLAVLLAVTAEKSTELFEDVAMTNKSAEFFEELVSHDGRFYPSRSAMRKNCYSHRGGCPRRQNHFCCGTTEAKSPFMCKANKFSCLTFGAFRQGFCCPNKASRRHHHRRHHHRRRRAFAEGAYAEEFAQAVDEQANHKLLVGAAGAMLGGIVMVAVLKIRNSMRRTDDDAYLNLEA